MPEQWNEAKSYWVEWACPKCEKPMKWTGQALTVHPMVYIHKCACGHTESLHAVYPCVRCKKVEGETFDLIIEGSSKNERN